MTIYANDSLELFASDIHPVELTPIYEETSYCPLTIDPSKVKSVRFFTTTSESNVRLLTSFEEISTALEA
jgi:hypothetical protein